MFRSKLIKLLLSFSLVLCALPVCYAYAEDSEEVSGNGEIRMDDDGAGEETGAPGQEVAQYQDNASGGGGSFARGSVDGSSEDDDSNSEWVVYDTGSDEPDSGIEYGNGGLDESYGGFGGVDDLIFPGTSNGIMTLAAGGSGAGGSGGGFSGGTGGGGSFSYTIWGLTFPSAGRSYWGDAVTLFTEQKYAAITSHLTASIYTALLYGFDLIQDMDSTIAKQWGYGYGGTAVVYSGSPAEYLRNVYARLAYSGTLENGSSGTWSIGQLMAYVFNYTRANNIKANESVDLLQKQWGYGYGGTVVSYSDSPYSFLKSISDAMSYSGTLGDGASGTWYPTQLLAYINNWTRATWERTGEVRSSVDLATSLLKYTGTLGDGNEGTFTAGQLLSYINNWTRATWERTGEVRSSVDVVSSLLKYTGKLADGNEGTFTAGQLLSYINNWTRATWERLGEIHTFLKYSDSNVSVDMNGVESRLDYISGLLITAGQVENAKDFIGDILGSFEDMETAALSAEVQAALTSAFPFCVPALIKQFLGLLEAEPMPPAVDFEIGGEVMHVDMSGMQGFADVVSWACRLLLVFGLVVSSRRFIYTPGGVAA